MQIICGGLDHFLSNSHSFLSTYRRHLTLQGTLRLALASVVLASMMFAETGAAGLCPWVSAVTMEWTGSGQPTGPRKLRATWSEGNGACSLGPRPRQPTGAQQDFPGQRAIEHVLFVTQLELTAHTISPLFFSLCLKSASWDFVPFHC